MGKYEELVKRIYLMTGEGSVINDMIKEVVEGKAPEERTGIEPKMSVEEMLRWWGKRWEGKPGGPGEMMLDTADEVEALRAESERRRHIIEAAFKKCAKGDERAGINILERYLYGDMGP